MASIIILAITIATFLHATAGINPCITNCAGKSNGDYQSCNACNVYATCSNGLFIDNRPCATPTLAWDDVKKTCEETSKTCPTIPCVSSCVDRTDGDYQSCKGCSFYLTCSNGMPTDNRPCAAGTQFDSTTKRCETSSTTCNMP